MGDGGVTLAPCQHAAESVFSSSSNCFGSEKKMRKGDACSEKDRSLEEKPRGKDLERRSNGGGELEEFNGCEVELGEFVPEKPARRSEADRRWKKGGGAVSRSELEKGEFAPERPTKREPKLEVEKKGGNLGKGEYVSDGWPKWEVEKKDHHGSGRNHKIELEKGELVPEKNSSHRNKVEAERRGGEREKTDHVLGRARRMEVEKGESIPDSIHRRKDGARGSDIDNRKRPLLSSPLNSDSRKSSRAPEEEPGEFKYESSNGKTRDKDHLSESWPKQHCRESESNGRKYRQELSDSTRSKSRRKSEERTPPRAGYPERSHGNPPLLSSKASSSIRHSSSKHHEQFASSRGSVDNRDRTPSHSDRSPAERSRHHDSRDHRDNRDRTPSHSDLSPVGKTRSRHHDHRDHLDYRDRTPSYSDRSPVERSRYRDRTPSHADRSPAERARRRDHKDRSPHDRRRAFDVRERNKKSGGGEKQQPGRHEDRSGRRESGGRDGTRSSSQRRSRSGTCSDDKPSKKAASPDWVKESGELSPPPPPDSVKESG